MTDEYKTRTISHNLQDLLELIDSERFAEVLNKRIWGVQYEAEMVKYTQFDDEIRHGWEIDRMHGYLIMTDGTISDRNTAAFVLGRAILDTLEDVFIEPRFLDGYGD
jgi:hypothetical protein